MRLITAAIMLMFLMLGCPTVGHAQAVEVNVQLALPRIGGWVTLPDGVTLIVALPDDAKLAYIDTVTGKELKRVELPFKPDRLAVQGKRLFASVEGVSAVHFLDLDSGADKKGITLPASVMDMVCHPKTGPLFAATLQGIMAINPETGDATLTGDLASIESDNTLNGRVLSRAGGNILAIDPSNANTLYTGWVYDTGRHNRSSGFSIAKFAVSEKAEFNPRTANFNTLLLPVGPFWPLKSTETSPTVAGDGTYHPLHISGDGKKVGTLSDAGIVLLTANNIKTQAGTIACSGASDLAFHPALNLMAVAAENVDAQGGRATTLHVFNSDSLEETGKFDFSAVAKPVGNPACRLLTFGDRGTKLLYYDWKTGILRSLPLTLTEKDRKVLAVAYPVRKEVK